MSDFKFSCPSCGQHIVCDTSNVGMSIACPGCQTTLTVPAPPPAAAAPAAPPGLSIAASQARHTAFEAQAHANQPYHSAYAPQPASTTASGTQKTSGLAIASFICSLSFCLGFIPGIICGHLARRNIKRDPSLKGGGLAMAGLIISYLSLTVSIVGIAISHTITSSPEFKKAYAEARQKQEEIRAGHSTTSSDSSVKKFSTGSTADDSLWNLNLTTAQFPDHPAAGRISGQDFTVERASVQGGIITLRQGQDFLPDRSMTIFTFMKEGESLAGKTYDLSPANSDLFTGTKPHIHISWKPEGATSSTNKGYTTGYALKLQLGAASADGTIPAKIYACLPDDQKSYVAGTFDITTKSSSSTSTSTNTPATPKKPKKPKKPATN